MDIIKIEIKTEHVNEKSGISAKSQKPYKIREQIGWVYTFAQDGSAKPYPEECRLNLEDGAFAYKPGFYTVAPSSYYVDTYGKLCIGRGRLAPMSAVLKSAA